MPLLPLTPIRSLLGLTLLKQVAQFHARLMQLRFTIADRTSHHLGNFVMLVTLNIMQDKDDTVSGWQAFYGAL
jgi:hypothetical protein